jgi:hypothetical protein
MYDDDDRFCGWPCHICEPEIKMCVCGEYYDSEEPDEVEDHKDCHAEETDS